MAQWVNRLRNKIFVKPPPLPRAPDSRISKRRTRFLSVTDPPLPLLCEISGALHLAQPGLTAGRLADEIQVNFEIFNVGCRSKYSTCRFVNQGTASLQPYQLVFSGKAYCKVDFLSAKFSRSRTISYQSLLLSTTILNDCD